MHPCAKQLFASMIRSNTAREMISLSMGRCNPRFFSGTQPTSHALDLLVSRWLRAFDKRVSDSPEKAFAAWDAVVGLKISALARPLTFSEGILTVRVQNSTLMSLLAGTERKQILQRLRRQYHLPLKQIHLTR